MDAKPTQKKTKAFILAAGNGSRLRPLTNNRPKPLLPFMNREILFHILDQIKQTDITEVCINVHYKKEMIKEALERYDHDSLRIFVSEEEKLLGTGGALAKVSDWREGADLLVINSDIIHTLDLSRLLEAHRNSPESPVTLAITKDPVPGESKLWCQDGKLFSFDTPSHKNQTAHCFACLQVISDRLLSKLPKAGSYSVIPLYKELLKQDLQLKTVLVEGFWLDIGTPQKYLEAHEVFLKMMESGKKLKHPAFENLPSNLRDYRQSITDAVNNSSSS